MMHIGSPAVAAREGQYNVKRAVLLYMFYAQALNNLVLLSSRVLE
jgi:hypothetical protein